MADPSQVTQVIDALPESPKEGAGFRTRCMAFFAGLIKLALQLEIFRGQLNTVAVEVNDHAVAAAAGVAAAATAVDASTTATTQAGVATEAAGAATAALATTEATRDVTLAARDEAVTAALDAGGIKPSLGAATGDLIAFSAPGVPARVGLGQPGQALLAAPGGVPGVAWGDTLRPTDITNAGFSVWSSGTLESAYSSVDLLAGTGNFETDADVALWTPGNGATATRDTANAVHGSSCLKLANDGSNNAGYDSRSFETIAGHVYKAVCHAKAIGSNYAYLKAGTSAGGSEIASIYTPYTQIGAVVRLEVVFEAVGTTTYLSVANQPSVPGGIGYFDSITLYDMGPNLVINGTFNTDTAGWAVTNGTFSSVAGGINGNFGQVVNGTNVAAKIQQQFTGLIVGRLYRLVYYKGALATGCPLPYLGSTQGGFDVINGIDPLYSTVGYSTLLFEATATSLWLTVQMDRTTTGAAFCIDSITLTDVTVGCVDYNTKALDLWDKDCTAQCWRETSRTKGGYSYALRVYGGKVYWSDGGRAAKPEFYSRYADVGAVVKGLWAQSSVAGKARMGIIDSAGESWSDYHPGDGLYHYLQVTRTPAAGITSFQTVVDSGAGAEAIFSQPQLQRGSVLADGAFARRVGEWIRFSSIFSNTYASWTGRSSQPMTLLNVFSDSLGRIPTGCKGLLVAICFTDTSVVNKVWGVNGNGTPQDYASGEHAVAAYVSATGAVASASGTTQCDKDGSIYVGGTTGGTSTGHFTLRYSGVQL